MKHLLLLLGFAVACAPAVVPPREVAAGNPCVGPEPALGRTEQSVVARLGPPKTRTVQRIPNRHEPNVTDEIVKMVYDGATVTLHTVPHRKASFLAALEITGRRFDVIPGLGIGMSRAAAAERLGLANAAGSEVRKECPLELPPTIVVQFDGDRVSNIVWLNEPD